MQPTIDDMIEELDDISNNIADLSFLIRRRMDKLSDRVRVISEALLKREAGDCNAT